MGIKQTAPQYSEQQVTELKGHFDATLARGGTLRRSTLSPFYFESMGFGLHYCFEYGGNHSPQYYEAVRDLIQGYRGAYVWLSVLEFNGKGACASSKPVNQMRAGRSPAFVPLQQLIGDAHQLCDYLGQNLAPSEAQAGSEVRPARFAPLSDPDDPGLFDIYVLANPHAGIYGPLHSADRKLHFGPKADEWKGLISALSQTSPDLSFEQLQSDSGRRTRKFPLLSRLGNPYISAEYEPAELQPLEEECRALVRLVGENEMHAAISKIKAAIGWAQESSSGLLFVPAN
jgi:hypothetical protein